jgi:dephospho-CoA kinase
MPAVLKVGLTGGIAVGKSAVGEMFAALGVHVIQADEIAHQLMQPGEPVYLEVVARFGPGILHPDGSVNRSRLAELAFGAPNQPSRVQELNQIVHPAVIRRQEEWMIEVGRRNPGAIAMVEAALILEAGMSKSFDHLIVVTCLPEHRIDRWVHRQKGDPETARREIMRRMAAQLPDEEKIKAAGYVIDNSGSRDETARQVKEIYGKLKQEAEA